MERNQSIAHRSPLECGDQDICHKACVCRSPGLDSCRSAPNGPSSLTNRISGRSDLCIRTTSNFDRLGSRKSLGEGRLHLFLQPFSAVFEWGKSIPPKWVGWWSEVDILYQPNVVVHGRLQRVATCGNYYSAPTRLLPRIHCSFEVTVLICFIYTLQHEHGT